MVRVSAVGRATPEEGDPEHVGADREIVEAAHDLRVVVGQLIRRLRAEYAFSIASLTVLGQIDRDGPSTTSSLADFERVRPQTMAQTIAELESAGLVTRSPDPSDKRQVLVALTDAGRRRLAEEASRRDTWLAQALEERFAPRERAALIKAIPLLRRLTS